VLQKAVRCDAQKAKWCDVGKADAVEKQKAGYALCRKQCESMLGKAVRSEVQKAGAGGRSRETFGEVLRECYKGKDWEARSDGVGTGTKMALGQSPRKRDLSEWERWQPVLSSARELAMDWPRTGSQLNQLSVSDIEEKSDDASRLWVSPWSCGLDSRTTAKVSVSIQGLVQ